MKDKQKIIFYSILIIAFISFAIPVFFLKSELLAGLFGVIGVFLFLFASRLINKKLDFFTFLVMLWLSIAIRFSTIFGKSYKLGLLLATCFIPAIITLGFGIIFSHYLNKRKLYFLQVLVFPIVYTLIAMVVVLIKLGNIVNIMTYIMCIPFFNYSISIFKEFGLTFIYTLIISLSVNLLIVKQMREKLLTLVPIAILLLIMLIPSIFISCTKTESDFSLNVAIATHEKMDFLGNREIENTKEDRYNIFKNAVEKAKENNADLLVLNEEFCEVYEEDEEEALKFYSETIKNNAMPTIVCIELLKEDELCINKALFFDKDGNILATYIKNNLVPFIEASYFEKGNSNPEYIEYDFNGNVVNISIAICFDIDNDFFMNKVNDKTELLIIPSWDWDNCNLEQTRTKIRSIELNTTVLKHTYCGISYVSGPFGLTSDYIDNRYDYECVKIVNVPIWNK